MKFEDYFATPSRDILTDKLAQSPLCPNKELLDGICSLYSSCKECWENALINNDLAEKEQERNKRK